MCCQMTLGEKKRKWLGTVLTEFLYQATER